MINATISASLWELLQAVTWLAKALAVATAPLPCPWQFPAFATFGSICGFVCARNMSWGWGEWVIYHPQEEILSWKIGTLINWNGGFTLQFVEILVIFLYLMGKTVINSKKIWIWRCISQQHDDTTWGFAVLYPTMTRTMPKLSGWKVNLLMPNLDLICWCCAIGRENGRACTVPSRTSLEWLELRPVLKGLMDNILNHFEMNSHLVIICYIILLICFFMITFDLQFGDSVSYLWI